MKKIFTLVALLLCLTSFAQTKIVTRVFNGYTVEYTYNVKTYSPAWEDNKKIVYYTASIQIYKDSVKIGNAIQGLYCEKPSLKDDPEQWISKAKTSNQ